MRPACTGPFGTTRPGPLSRSIAEGKRGSLHIGGTGLAVGLWVEVFGPIIEEEEEEAEAAMDCSILSAARMARSRVRQSWAQMSRSEGLERT